MREYKWLLLIVIGMMLPSGATAQETGDVLTMKRKQLEAVEKSVSLGQTLQHLEKAYDINIFYKSREVEGKFVNNITKKLPDIEIHLRLLLEPLGMTYRQLTETSFVVYRKERPGDQNTIQQETVNGQVTDAESGETLPGVNIMVKGTTTGTSTDGKGQFELNVPSLQDTLMVTYIGYQQQEIPINGQTTLDIELEREAIFGDEVVVTAFGISQERRGLGSSVQEVDGSSLSKTGNTDVIKSLQGKVAGVTVRQSSGAPGARPQVTIRGSRSFVGNNEPLYVIDGVPVEGGDRAIDINSGDIESLNVLKGPSAASLYGLRASNGVIVITTKSGEGIEGKPMISYDMNVSMDKISVWPDIQQTYMQGTPDGGYEPYSAFSWGPRIDEMGTYTNQLGEEEEAKAYYTPDGFFQTGHTLNNNLNIANSFEGGNYSFGFGHTDQEGIIPNSEMDRANIKFRGEYDLIDNLTVGASINYSRFNSNRIPTGGGNSSPFYAAFWAPVSYDLVGKPTHVEGEPFNQINFRGQHDNIYWSIRNNYQQTKTNRVFGNINAAFEMSDWISINYRLGIDTYTNSDKTVWELGSGTTGGRTDPPSGGSINDGLYEFQQINSNINLQMSQSIGNNFEIDLLLGNEFNDRRSRRISSSGDDIIIGGFHNIANTGSVSTNESIGRSRVVGFFGDLSADWKNILTLSLTGRNDIVSNMPRGNRSFFYPSIGAGFIFTELLNTDESILSFAKLRASIAEVGQPGPTFSTKNIYVPGGGGGFEFPFQGINAFTVSSNLNSETLEPENTRTIELGSDLEFLKNRIGIDYTYFKSKSDGQIFRVPIAYSTGYASELRNSGEMSTTGHEVIFSAIPIAINNFNWEINTNFTTYENKVEKLAEGISSLSLGGAPSGIEIVAEEGKPYPSLIGSGYARDPNTGEIVVNRDTGMPLRATDDVHLGKVQPDFEIGFSNTFSYRNFALDAQIDWRRGGNVFSGTNRLGKLYGAAGVTEHRDENYIFPGKKGYYDGNGELIVEGDNDIEIKRGFDFYRVNQDAINESNVYDASYLRLREIILTYYLPQSLVEKTFLSNASNIYLSGKNFILHSNMPNTDPEMNRGYGGGNDQGIEYGTYPLTKSFTVGLSLRF